MTDINPLELSCEVKEEIITCTKELCRLCAKSVTSYSSIFQDNLHEYLALIFGVSIQQNDNWPKSICNICLELAKNYVKFVLSVRRAETSLRSIYGELSNTPEPGISFINVQEILNPEDTRDHGIEGSDENENEDKDVNVHETESEDSLDNSEMHKIANKRKRKESHNQDAPPKGKKSALMEENDGASCESEAITQKKNRARPSKSKPPTQNRRVPSTDKSKEEDERIKKFFKMECSVCSNPFETYNELKSHAIKIHNDQKLAFIICCKKKLDNRTKIVNHLNHHTKPDAYKCPKPGCSKTFLTPTGLYSHQLNKHVKGKEKIKCVHCSQSFLTLYRLKSHELKHLNGNEEKQKFKCKWCDKEFALNSLLLQHIRFTHDDNGDDMHTCKLCFMTFRSKYSLILHMSIHKSSD
ncbi:zinc finger protein 501-like [Phlebotomus papatasi]|uniref:zinc finger protein 501-like n=1 Tax=Phlebotomus papatasi TaxID=29031 RepID=UPI0024846522|nr:zinc finger protein 501-like [Phlebotomus papatasi]